MWSVCSHCRPSASTPNGLSRSALRRSHAVLSVSSGCASRHSSQNQLATAKEQAQVQCQAGSEVVQTGFRGGSERFRGGSEVVQSGSGVVHRGARGNSEVCQALQEPSRKLPWTHYATGWLVWQSAAAYVSGMLALDSPTHRTWYDDGQPSQHTSVPPPPHMQHTSSFASSCRRAKSEHAHCDAPGLA